MTKPTIEDLRDALARMVKGEHRLHIPVQDTDEDLMLAAALDELEMLRKVADAAKEWKRSFNTRRLIDAVDELEKFEASEMTFDERP